MAEKIFGYEWEDIKRAQQGGRLAKPLAPFRNDGVQLLPKDLEMLEEHGIDGLAIMGFHGVLDRLRRAGKINIPEPGECR